MKSILIVLITAIVTAGLSYVLFIWYSKKSINTYPPLNPGREFVELAERSKAAVVFIKSSRTPADVKKETLSDIKSGSGVIVTQDGFIVTNFHVVSGQQEIHVLLADDFAYQARVMGTDSSHDIALLKIQAVGLPFLPFGNSDSVRVGEDILAIGNPFQLRSTVTKGIVSGLDRDIKVEGNMTDNYIQIDAPTQEGSSGGAVVNVHGQLIAIPVAIVSGDQSHESFALAMPSNLVSRIVNDIIKHGALVKGSLGMSIRKVTQEIATQSGMKEIYGIVVEALEPGGAADLAGIQSLDVLLYVNDHKITSVSDFQEKWKSYYPGDSLEIIVNRLGKLDTLEMVIQHAKEKN